MNRSRLKTCLLASTIICGAISTQGVAFAQEVGQQPGVEEPVLGDNPAQATDESRAQTAQNDIVVTGSRIARPNLEANSPIAVVTGEQAVQNADITLDTFLNTLPQVNPAGTTTSNNPGNGGQSNINLRGLGTNRNLVLIDGRRPMVSNTAQSVDMNTIPQGLIERIEVVTGGAGATYGADAIAGVVNIRLKDNFEGVDLRATYSNSVPLVDAEEYQISGVIGGNFADNRGNIAVAFDYSDRQSLIKSQRAFAEQATSTTGTPPMGRFVESSANPVTQAAIDAVFGAYGVAAAQRPTVNGSQMHFNSDGTLFGGGIFNSPLDVSNYRYGVGGPAGANANFYPDFYSYNFDAINLLVLPLKRKSAFLRGNYEISPSFDVFVQGGYTEYSSANALAPTPLGTRIYNGPPNGQYANSALVTPGLGCVSGGNPSQCFVTGLVVPVTNPFIPADLATLLASRTGDDRRLVGSGATEPFLLAKRVLDTGLRQSVFDNQVIQVLGGVRGDITDGWRYEVSYSWGRTTQDTAATGNVNVQKLQQLIEAPDGGVSICTGGYNPFGIKPLSQECIDYIDETGFTSTVFTQKIVQGYVTGDLAELPGGTMSVVLGAEQRNFRYDFDPGALFGPIAGFNTSVPAGGTNKFTDYFTELLVPIMRNQKWAESLELTLGYRRSISDFNDIVNGIDGEKQGADAYKAELSWAPVSDVRIRASYQRSVRAPNFGELFAGGGSFPQIFDPCTVGTDFRDRTGAAGAALCAATGVGNPANFAATPGAQAPLGLAGNPNLKPETGDTITFGAVFNAYGFTGSIDYYNIKLSDAIFAPDPNTLIAACYGYIDGINQNLDADNPYCGAIFRQGSQISALVISPELGGDANSNFISVNQGKVKTSGIDVQLGYRLPLDSVQEGSALNLNLLVNYLIDFKQEVLPGVTQDFAGTASYFGQGLGTSFPRWKGTLNAAWNLDPVTLSTRIRYIDAMKNRAAVQYAGETFTGPGSVWYFDFAAETTIENMTFRLGVNNAFNRLPPTYAPNVQSGTDPSLYDVIGRRVYVSGRLKF